MCLTWSYRSLRSDELLFALYSGVVEAIGGVEASSVCVAFPEPLLVNKEAGT